MNSGYAHYNKHFWISMILYTAIICFNSWWFEFTIPLWQKIICTVSPIIACVYCAWACIGRVLSLDELQKKIQLEGIAFGFTVGVIASITYAFMQIYLQLPSLNHFYTYGFLMAFYAIGTMLSTRKYQ